MKKTESTELTVVERAAVALGTSERETQLVELIKESSTIVAIKNNAGRDQCHSAAMKLRTTRVEIEKAGKAAREDATAFSKAVIAEEKRLVAITGPEEERLLALRDVWDEARELERRAKVEAEARRVAGIRAKVDGIRAYASIMVGQPSTVIDNTIKMLVALPIDVEHFAELTGDTEFARGETLDKLRNLHEAAIRQEAEAKRLAEENERLARERAEFEEQQRKAAVERAEEQRRDAAARAEQERKDAEARAAREAEERAQREREEAARLEQQAKEDAERRAVIKQEEARLRAEREEMQRRQAELDRAEQEARAREEAALREMAEAEERARREKRERERADNVASQLAPAPTHGNWSIGKTGGCVVSDLPVPGAIGTGHNDVEHYGGYLICESVWRPADAHVLASARDMFDLLNELVALEGPQPGTNEWANKVIAVLKKATYVPELQTEEAAA